MNKKFNASNLTGEEGVPTLTLNRNWPGKRITYVLLPDHLHLIANPQDGRIKEFTGQLKAVSAKAIMQTNTRFVFAETDKGHQVWQESFKDVALWSGWMIWQKINYIHANPVKAGLVSSAKDYHWSGFRSFSTQSDEPLAVDHDWWWPEDSETSTPRGLPAWGPRKLSQAMKEMGWYSFEKRR